MEKKIKPFFIDKGFGTNNIILNEKYGLMIDIFSLANLSNKFLSTYK